MLIISLISCQPILSLKARGGGGGGGSSSAGKSTHDAPTTLPPTFGYAEETHYISDGTFKVINETLSPYEPKNDAELKELEETIT